MNEYDKKWIRGNQWTEQEQKKMQERYINLSKGTSRYSFNTIRPTVDEILKARHELNIG